MGQENEKTFHKVRIADTGGVNLQPHEKNIQE